MNLWSSGREHDIDDSIELEIFNCFQEDIEVANVMNLSSKSSSSSEEIELHQIQTHVSSESLVSFVFGLLLLLLLLLLKCTYNWFVYFYRCQIYCQTCLVHELSTSRTLLIVQKCCKHWNKMQFVRFSYFSYVIGRLLYPALIFVFQYLFYRHCIFELWH